MKPTLAIALHELKRLYRSFLLLGSVAAVLAASLPSLLILVPWQQEQRKEHLAESVDLRTQVGFLRSVSRFGLEVSLPPPPLAFLSRGYLEEIDPRVEFGRLSPPRLKPLAGHGAVIGYLFPSTDVMALAAILFSLIPFAFGCGVFSGEKERGTLRMALANPLPRSRFLTGKLLGLSAGLAAPWLTLVAVCGAAVWLTPELRHSTGAADWKVFACLFFLVFLYGLVHLQAAFFVSTLTRATSNTLLALLFLWILSQVLIPSVALDLAQSLSPTRPSSESRLQLENLEREVVLSYARFLEESAGWKSRLGEKAVAPPGRRYFQYQGPELTGWITRDGDFWLAGSQPQTEQEMAARLPQLLRRQQEFRDLRRDIANRSLQSMRQQQRISRAAWLASPASVLRDASAELAGTGSDALLDWWQRLTQQSDDFFARLQAVAEFRANFGRRLNPKDEYVRILAAQTDALDVGRTAPGPAWETAALAAGYLTLLWLVLLGLTLGSAARYDLR